MSLASLATDARPVGWCARRLPACDAEDVVQDTLVSMLRWPVSESDERPVFWHRLRWQVAAYHQARRIYEDLDERLGYNPMAGWLELEHMRWSIQQAALSARQETALALAVIGYSMIEIADLLGVTETNVKGAIHQARRKLRRAYGIVS